MKRLRFAPIGCRSAGPSLLPRWRSQGPSTSKHVPTWKNTSSRQNGHNNVDWHCMSELNRREPFYLQTSTCRRHPFWRTLTDCMHRLSLRKNGSVAFLFENYDPLICERKNVIVFRHEFLTSRRSIRCGMSGPGSGQALQQFTLATMAPRSCKSCCKRATF
jgi:hypothetical protein